MSLTNGAPNGVADGANELEFIMQRARKGSRSLPFMTDTLGNSLNDRLLFAVPKSKSPIQW